MSAAFDAKSWTIVDVAGTPAVQAEAVYARGLPARIRGERPY